MHWHLTVSTFAVLLSLFAMAVAAHNQTPLVTEQEHILSDWDVSIANQWDVSAISDEIDSRCNN